MLLVTKRSLIDTAADRYRAAHTRRGVWLPATDGMDPKAVYDHLSALPEDASEAAVTAAVGDDRYTANICDECGQDRDITVHMATEIHHPTDTVAICAQCLAAAIELIDRG
jgi:hypothetical protein